MDSETLARREHQAVWELLPWHQAGVLDAAEAGRVAAHLRVCPSCAAEYAQGRKLGQAVRAADPTDSLAAASFARLRPRLAAVPPRETAAATPPGSRWRARLARALTGPDAMRRALLAQGAVLAGLLLLVLWPQASPPPGYTTLTRPPAIADALGVRVADGVTEAALRGRLLALGLRIVDGPDGSGRYRLAPAGAAWDSATLQALLAAPELRLDAPP